MANRYDTNNAVGSADPRDLFDNSIVIDEFANSDSETAVDRLGQTRRTIVGLRADVAVAIGDAGYTGTGTDGAVENYAAGIEITQYNQIVRDTNGEFWKVTGATDFPYTTTGAGLPEGGTFVSVGDFALRQDLADPAQGGDLVKAITSTGTESIAEALNSRVIYFDTIADMLALPTNALRDGQQAQVVEYSGGTDLGGGSFYWDASSTEADDGGTVFAVSGISTGRWKRVYKGETYLVDFGAVDDGTDQATIIDQLNTAGKAVNLSGKTFNYAGAFSPTATFYNGTISATNRSFVFKNVTEETPSTVLQGRARIDYGTPTSVKAWVPESIVMAGFRFMGSFRNPNGRQVPTGVNGSILVSNETDLSIINTKKLNQWYALFSVANKSDSVASFVNAPFFRAHSLTGNEITLAEGGETSGETPATTTYDMAVDVMVGSKVLVIQEGGDWSGRTATVTSNTTGTITLDDVTGISKGDFFLVAPPEYDDYCYLGGWYTDGAEPRNRADTGTVVGATHFQIPALPATGALSNYEAVVRGMICPLATSYVLRLRFFLQTSATGDVVHSFSHDSSNHNIAQQLYTKTSTGTENVQIAPLYVPFSKTQSFFVTTAGSLDASVGGRQFQCYGWIEP